MKRNFPLIVVFALLFGGLLSACNFAAPAAQAPDLNGTEWQLTALNGVPLSENIRITLRFEEGLAGGQAPCNGYGASYVQDGSALTFDQVVSTLMYCEGGMDYEAEYLATLALVKSFQLENNVLTLLDENGAAVLVFGLPQPAPEASVASSALEGTEWQLTSLNGAPLPEKVHITLRFENGEVRGRAACNIYNGVYSQDSTALSFGQGVERTEMWCEDDEFMAYEDNYLAVFAQVKSFQLDSDVLSLLDENGAVILVYSLSQVFVPRPPDEFPLVIETVIVTIVPPIATKVP